MSGYIGSTPVVTQVDGYNRTEADAEFVDVTGDTVTGSLTVDQDLTVDTNTLHVDSANNRVGIGTSSPATNLEISDTLDATIRLKSTENKAVYTANSDTHGTIEFYSNDASAGGAGIKSAIRSYVANTAGGQSELAFSVSDGSSNDSEAMRIDSSGTLLVNDPDGNAGVGTNTGAKVGATGSGVFARDNGPCIFISRVSTDGTVIDIRQDGTTEGSISVSGTTVSYNGGHLSRWSRLPDGTDDTHIYKGTVMTNLDEMCEWRDEQGDLEDNEQLNKTTVSSEEGDPNVAGLFVAWDHDDDWGDYYLAMTGDLVVRIAQGVTVQRGDLLMSAGDGTAKPQGDDIVRSKTVAKVTSTHVSHTYPDGSYAVPCVVMAS